MKTEHNKISDTKSELTISAGEKELSPIKQITQKRLQPGISAPGFRKGKVPLNMVEKHADDNFFKSQFLDDALTELYRNALEEHKIRPLSQPQVEIKKFVPYSEIEFSVTVEVVPPIKLADYKKLSHKAEAPKVTAADVSEVIENLQKRTAEKSEVERAAKDGDEVVINFEGTNDKGEDVAGASGKDYPIVIGSDTFIKGFEENVIGMKAGEDKTFTLTFPKDYAHKPLAGKDVTFAVTATAVKEVTLPKLDEKFVASVGPFKTVDQLKDDIKTQLMKQKEQESEGKLKDAILEELVSKSKLEAPEQMVEQHIGSLLTEFQQNLTYRGITFPEYLKQAGQTEEEYKESELKPKAVNRVKTGLVLAEISELEKIQVTPEELEIRMTLLKGQYQNDEQMQAQLETPDAQNEIASRLVTEKTIDKLVEYATA